MCDVVLNRNSDVHLELQKMNYIIGDTFVDYELCRYLEKAHKAGVFENMGIQGENEDRHVSELDRRMRALDEKEVFITVKAIVENNWETFAKTIIFLKKEGEKNNDGIIRDQTEIRE